MSKIILGGVGLSVIVSIFACTSVSKKATPEETAQFSLLLEKERQKQTDILSPYHFRHARELLSEGKVTEAEESLSRAQETARTAHKYIADVIEQRKQAIDAGAPESDPKGFAIADMYLERVGINMEQLDWDSPIDHRVMMGQRYSRLELKAISSKYLSQTENLIDQAVANRAAQIAPQELAIAKEKLNEAATFIKAHRHDPGIASRVASAHDAAEKLSARIRDHAPN